MKNPKFKIKKPKLSFILGALGLVAVVLLLSSTIGRSLYQGVQLNIFYLYLLNFLGYLFFLIMPVEALVPYYLGIGFHWLYVGLIVLVTALIAQMVDYAIGRCLPSRVIENILGTKKYDKFKKIVDRYGAPVIFFFNLFPLSSPIVVLLAGMERYSFWKTMRLCFFGLLIKYAVLILVTLYLLENITFF